MNKKIFIVSLIAATSLITGCGNNFELHKAEEINQSRILNICELSTLECTYHNVAKADIEGKQFLFIKAKDRKAWIQYDGTAKLSFDTEKIKLSQNNENISISLPEPDVNCSLNGNTIDTVISNQGIIKNPFTAEKQSEAIADAQKEMEANIKADSGRINDAKEQAKNLITNYITQIGDMTGTEYNITWK